MNKKVQRETLKIMAMTILMSCSSAFADVIIEIGTLETLQDIATNYERPGVYGRMVAYFQKGARTDKMYHQIKDESYCMLSLNSGVQPNENSVRHMNQHGPLNLRPRSFTMEKLNNTIILIGARRTVELACYEGQNKRTIDLANVAEAFGDMVKLSIYPNSVVVRTSEQL